MEADINALVEMGFDKQLAENALKEAGDTGLEGAINWIEEQQKKTLQKNQSAQSTAEESASAAHSSQENKSAEGATAEGQQEAKSFKCQDCGKMFKSPEQMEFHAAKTGHVNFGESTEEIKPLTEEEKKQKALELERRWQQKQKDREEEARKEEIEREKKRREMGVNMALQKQKFQEEEMKIAAEQRRREKEEDRAYLAKLRAQIAADRAAKEAESKGASSAASKPAPATVPVSSTSTPASTAPARNYDEARLQVRLPSGELLKETFAAGEPLSAVRLLVCTKARAAVQPMTGDLGPSGVTFMTNLPRKVYSEEELQRSLKSLGLVPSATLILCKK